MQSEAQLNAFLQGVRQRWTTVAALRMAGRAGALAAVPLLAAAVADRLLRPQGAALILLAATTCLLAAGVLAAAAWRWPRRPTDRQVARFVEERAARLPGGHLDDQLVSAVAALDAAAPSERTSFLPLLVDAAVRRLAGIHPADVVPPSQLRRSAAEAGLSVAIVLIACALALPAAGRVLHTARAWLAGTPDATAIRRAANASSASAPRVTRIDLHYTYPAFSQLAPRHEQDGGDVYAPAGTRVRFTVHTDKPLARGELALGSASLLSLKATDDCSAEAQLVLARDDSYRIRLAGADGLQSTGEAEYFIRLMDDRPPDVRILRPSSDQPITPLEEVPIEARADDDYGIRSFDLVYAVAGGPEHVATFDRVSGTNEQKIGSHLLAAEDLHVKPGDVITYYARARDVARGKPSSLVTSDIYFLEVKPFNEEFVSAPSQAGSGGGDPQIDSLIEAQKQIIASTWNVERRAAGGRSAADIRAIAEAQAELKGRAERQLASRSRRGRLRAPAPERLAQAEAAQRASAVDPIATAIEAMSQALQQLGAERTKDALAHEMSALNGLLQAQAEVRRRQVTQQANGGGGGGGNRSEQDLSALFDKELQRDQKTNYENRAAVETRSESQEKKESALDRIRELARRQEDLNQRQRDLARSAANAEERKRQLEKLTREQEELRRELEDLARRQNRAGSKDSPDLRGAGQQMRRAASELGRSDPTRAAESGQRASDQLKRLEREMSGGAAAPGRGRPGSAADAQAQQLSEQLEQTRAIRERVQRAEQAMRDAEARASQPRGQTGVRPGSDRGQTPRGQTPRGQTPRGQTPAQGERGQTPGRAGEGAGGELQRLRDAYQRELQKAQEALARLGGGESRRGDAGATPEHEQFSHSAPGTEAFKQDRSEWESLRKNVDQALEKYEAAVSSRLSRSRTDDRFSAGGSDRVPEAYRRLIARYFESVAKQKP